MQNALTLEESAELAGLRAYAAKGKLVPGSDDQRRMLELVRVEGGGDRITAAPPKWDRERIQEFYGVKRRFTFEIQEIGEKMGIPPPWETPIELGKWFAQARAKGLRHRSPPPSIQSRIRSAELTSLKAAGLPHEEESPPPILPPPASKSPAKLKLAQPDLPDIGTGHSKAADTLQYLEKRAYFLEQQILAGNDMAGLLSSELKDIHKSKREWSVSIAKIQANDEETQAQIKAQIAVFAGGLWQILRRAFLQGCSPTEKPLREAVLNNIATDLPDLLEEHFGASSGESPFNLAA